MFNTVWKPWYAYIFVPQSHTWVFQQKLYACGMIWSYYSANGSSNLDVVPSSNTPILVIQSQKATIKQMWCAQRNKIRAARLFDKDYFCLQKYQKYFVLRFFESRHGMCGVSFVYGNNKQIKHERHPRYVSIFVWSSTIFVCGIPLMHQKFSYYIIVSKPLLLPFAFKRCSSHIAGATACKLYKATMISNMHTNARTVDVVMMDFIYPRHINQFIKCIFITNEIVNNSTNNKI